MGQSKCGVFFGGMLGAFKVLPLALVAMHCQVSYATLGYLVTDHDTGASGVGTDGRNQWSEAPNWKDKENVIFAPISKNGQNSDKRFVKGVNTNIYQSVIIGPKAAGRNAPDQKNNTSVTGGGMTVVGYNAIGWQSQATAIGNNVYAAGQGTALGSDVMAAGYSSIAIGNDDIAKKYQDKLPEKTIKQIYGYDHSTTYVGDTYKNIMTEEEFKKKYLIYQDGNQRIDNRIYSPTYSAGIGAIAIGSRSVAYGNASLSIGTLSFALADESTALGVRAFVDTNAEGGVAIGDESRVFAPNSFAIGNKAESTSQGSLSFGSNAKAVGQGSIAIGPSVASNAKLSGDGDEQFAEFIMRHTETAAPNIIDNGNNSADITYGADNGKELKFGNDSIVVKSGFAAHRTENKITTMIDKVIAEKEKKLSYSYDKRNEKLETTEKIYTTEQEGDHAISLGYHISNNGNNTITIGSASVVRGANSVVLGALNNVGKYATNTIAFGIGTNVYKENSIAIGTGVNVAGAGVVAIGSGVGVTKDNTIAVGYGAHSLSGESIVLGNSASLKENAEKSIVIGNGAKVENQTLTTRSANSGDTGFSAIAIGTSSNVMAKNSVGLGNKAEVSMKNSVALGYQSTTNYFYDNNNKSIATLDGSSDAIDLPGYFPQGSSYETKTDSASGIVSVGGWNNNGKVGFRRIVNVAAGALDSDVATVGQLKTLAYVKKEGVVTYYTTVNGETQKLVKSEKDNKFYRVNTENGEPLEKLGPVENKNVLAGPKGYNEQTVVIKGIKTANMGEVIKFGHIADGEIKDKSDQAITGNQINELIGILGIENKKTDKTVDYTKLNKKNFEAVEYVGDSRKGVESTHREAIDDLIKAVNSGYVFSDSSSSTNSGGANRNDIPAKFYLGSKVEIKAGDIPKQSSGKQATTPQYLGKNLKTKLSTNDKKSDAIFEIGFSDTPTFKNIQVTDDIPEPNTDKKKTYENYVVNKKYLDKRLSNVAANFDVKGDNFKASEDNTKYTLDKSNTELNIKGKEDTGNHKNITTSVSKADKSVTIELNSTLKGITSIGKDNDNKIVFDVNSQNSPIIKLGGIDLTLDKTANKVRISNVANGVSDNDAVNYSQLKEATLHFVSVKHPSGADSKENYANDGATKDGAIAIGVGAKAAAQNAVAIGHNAKSKAENAVVIGNNVSVDVHSSFVLGSNNTVTQNFKNTNGAVVVIGSGTELIESKSSIAIGAVKVGEDGTKIENAAWTASIGNKNKIKNGTDIVALGNNINIGFEGNGSDKFANTHVVAIGNKANAQNAENSVLIGAETKAENGATNAVIIGYKAKSKAEGGVAIGKSAVVEANAGDSIALGQESEATKKETALHEAKIETINVKFNFKGGVSADDKENNKKSVLSIGKTGKERQIKHVAAGAVTETSTDAINGSQLYAVADEFSKLAVNVLGAEVDTTSGFKKSEFTVVQYHGSTNTPAQKEMTFKDAIGQNTTAINKGFIFGSEDDAKGTHYLGDKLIIKAGAVDTPSTITAGEKYLPDNIKTKYLSNSKELLIGIKESPTFKNVLITEEIPEDKSTDPKKNTYDNYAVNKKYLDKRLEKVAANFTVKGDSNGTDGKGYTLDKEHNELNINGDSKNITTEVDKASKKIGIKLKDALTGITSIANNDTKIELKNNGGKSIVFTSGDNSKSVTLTGDKFSGVSEISKGNAKLILNDQNTSLELGTGKSKLELKENETTITAGTDAGSIKINNNGNKKIELSPENGATLTLEKSGTDKVKISGLGDGKITQDSNDAITGKQLDDLAGKLGVTVDTGKTGFIQPEFTEIKGSDNSNKKQTTFKGAIDDLITAVNKGISFKGNDTTNGTANMQLGGTLVFDSSESKTKQDGTKGKDITVKATADANDGNAKITLELNKAETVDENDERVVTSKAVADKLENYTTTTALQSGFLKVDGTNIGDAEGKKTFGK
ncbi:hypothetical protein HNR69_001925, partial [Histophilus somni]|nr:hypothetical protein [Histophilus somni]